MPFPDQGQRAWVILYRENCLNGFLVTAEFSHFPPDTGSVKKLAQPLLTIIVAVFNGKATLQKCIDSVRQQTYQNKELIIIDGGSTDGTVQLLEQNQDSFGYWVSEPDSGIYNAWNKGLAHANGEWICFIGADDYFWDVMVLERMAKELALLPDNIRVAYGQIMLVATNGDEPRAKGEPWRRNKEFFKEYMCLPHVGLMHRRSFFEQHGKFDESFRIAGDYELLLRELIAGDAEFLQGITSVAHVLGGISTQPDNYLPTLRETLRAQKMHGLKPGKYVLKEMMKERVRLFLWAIFGERMARKLLDLRRRIQGLPAHWTRT